MEELKKRVFGIMTEVHRLWKERIREADKTGEGIDSLDIPEKYSELVEKLNLCFIEFQQRHGKRKRWM